MKSKKCDLCDSPAKVFLTQVIGGQKKTMSLCPEHALSFDLEKLETYDLIPGIKGESLLAGGARCPSCGTTEAIFRKKGRCGCEHCYEHLSPLILPHLSNLHSGVIHVGKVPSGFTDPRIISNRLSHLQHQLKKAVASERYEDAAAYRDAISEMSQNESPQIST